MTDDSDRTSPVEPQLDHGERQAPFATRAILLQRIEAALSTPPVGLILLEILVDADPLGGPLDPGLADRALSARLGRQLRPIDIVLATEPDRHAIIRPGLIGPSEAEGLAYRLHPAMTAPLLLGERRAVCQVAIGVAASIDGDGGADLLRFAEHALGDARMLGGDTVVPFDDQDRDLLA